MTWRGLFLPHIWRMTVGTLARLLVLGELFFNGYGFWIRRLFVVLVTARAGGDWHIRRQSAQGRGTRDIDVTGRAFHDVLALAAFVRELC